MAEKRFVVSGRLRTDHREAVTTAIREALGVAAEVTPSDPWLAFSAEVDAENAKHRNRELYRMVRRADEEAFVVTTWRSPTKTYRFVGADDRHSPDQTLFSWCGMAVLATAVLGSVWPWIAGWLAGSAVVGVLLALARSNSLSASPSISRDRTVGAVFVILTGSGAVAFLARTLAASAWAPSSVLSAGKLLVLVFVAAAVGYTSFVSACCAFLLVGRVRIRWARRHRW